MEALMPSTMSAEAAIGYADTLYRGDYRHWNAEPSSSTIFETSQSHSLVCLIRSGNELKLN
jgi:hypothetical protein